MIRFKNDMTLQEIEKELEKGILNRSENVYIIKDLYKNYDEFPFSVEGGRIVGELSSDTVVNFKDFIDLYNLIEGSRIIDEDK